MLLSVIKDCYDNSILDYTLSDFNDNKLVFDNIDLVFNDFWDSTKVCILHSDQGFQYTNQQYLRKLDQYGVTILILVREMVTIMQPVRLSFLT
nr:DDE-type integrase/transposase/recombinase [Streptococcus mutans]